MRIQVYRWKGRWKTQCDVNCYTYACFRKSKSYVDTRCFTVNTPHTPFAVGKTMKTFRSDMSTYVKSCTRTRPRKSKWCRVISWSVVVVSRSLWSVLLRGWCLYFVVVMHTYLLRHMAGEYRGQCLDKCTGLGRTRVGGHETRPKPKPNVDYYLLSYLLLLLLLLFSNDY